MARVKVVEFVRQSSAEVDRVANRTDIERYPHPNLTRFSTIPWFDFTSVSHARNFELAEFVGELQNRLNHP